MKFYSATKTISVGIDAKPIFETLDKIRPNDISFSLMVAIAAEEYIKNHDKIKNLNSNDFKKLQLRLSQISTIIRKEVDLRI